MRSCWGAMRAFARRNQPILCSPFVLGGANTPASTAATMAQLNAEALAALAYTQVVNRGCPAIYGHFLATISMKSGAPMAGTARDQLGEFHVRPDGAALPGALAHLDDDGRVKGFRRASRL